MTSLENIYLFRHAAYRDVAYALQLPSERARLHGDAFRITEEQFAHEAELVAAELADHARLAQEGATEEQAAELARSELRYLLIAIKRYHARAQWEAALQASTRALDCPACGADARCDALTTRSRALQNLGRLRDAIDSWAELAEHAEATGNLLGQVQGISSGALLHVNLGNHKLGAEMVARGQALADASGDSHLKGKVLMDQAMLASARGDYVEDERLLTLALRTIAQDGSDSNEWVMRGNLANLYANTGRRELAIETYLELKDTLEAAGDGRHAGIAIANLGRQYMVGGQLEQAEDYLLQAIERATESGNLRSVAFALANLAIVDLQRGNFTRAESSVSRAVEIAREFGLVVYHAAYRCTWALLQLAQGHEAQAQETAEVARTEFISAGGEAFIPEFCGIVRLRIAASQAVTTPVPGRSTTRLRATPPSPSWLAVMRSLLEVIVAERDKRGNLAGTGLIEAAESGTRLVEEVAAAIAEKRPAMVFRGYLPVEMRPDKRHAVIQRLAPAEADTLAKLHPTLWQALNADLAK